MTISSAPAYRWEQLRPGVWWGLYGEDHIGSIAEYGWRFRTRDAADVWLGDYPTLQMARTVLQRR
ncbi:hypothetical protein GCM10009840_10690 [Pseudolysinimonas kribbensis]|uniref:Uncharacterized protein n=1 Tax=Pseudolysinimonas kribbensis TaxID=433641 RepID=A0ABQ6K9J8_9MICO|nr:hypothetical protein [Pseudolysinimonas kribbensis]GMA95492.1 hypothetical protein GCM10025881_23160 [Pseudolysinimonas kribbensis]